MKIWNQAPLVRLIIPFLGGIITAVCLSSQLPGIAAIIAFIFCSLSAIVLIPRFYISYKRSWLFGILLYAALFLLGYQLTMFRTEKFHPGHFSKFCGDQPVVVLARLEKPVIEKERSVKAVL